jgi:hypothetical protein
MTMIARRRSALVAALVLLVAVAAAASAGQLEKRSGSIVAIPDDAKTFVLAEVGPWQVRDGATVVTRRTIALTPETEFAIVSRADPGPGGFLGEFVETRIGPDGVYLNDYVTVECRHDGGRLVAVKITVVEPWRDS